MCAKVLVSIIFISRYDTSSCGSVQKVIGRIFSFYSGLCFRTTWVFVFLRVCVQEIQESLICRRMSRFVSGSETDSVRHAKYKKKSFYFHPSKLFNSTEKTCNVDWLSGDCQFCRSAAIEYWTTKPNSLANVYY